MGLGQDSLQQATEYQSLSSIEATWEALPSPGEWPLTLGGLEEDLASRSKE